MGDSASVRRRIVRRRTDASGPARPPSRARHLGSPLRMAARDGGARGARRVEDRRGSRRLSGASRRPLEGDRHAAGHRARGDRHGQSSVMRPKTAATIVVLAKAPVAGRVKTRLCPPLMPQEAATLAEAALSDTLVAVLATRCARRVLALDGAPGLWLPTGIEVIGQRGERLDERISCAFDDVGGPALLIGSDTPQVSTTLLV